MEQKSNSTQENSRRRSLDSVYTGLSPFLLPSRLLFLQWWELQLQVRQKLRSWLSRLYVDAGKTKKRTGEKSGVSQLPDQPHGIEPIPQPQILIHSSYNTSSWCNVTLECGTPGATGNLTVTWLGKGFHEPTPNSRNLSLSLPLSQVNAHLICVVSNPADQKNATLDLGSICLWTGSLWSKWLWKGIFATVLVVSLGAGVWIWKRRKTETERGGSTFLPVVPSSAVVPQALPTEDSADLQTREIESHSPPYAEISLRKHPKTSTERGSGHKRSPEQTPTVHTVYEKIRTRT
ncbi:uncharacterized protein LOC111751963 isoform X2 [Loxodonta africana]|uniref:uncharacterized protein LOC111751963 isoform X2 n=1 Tax=Loxodonta africana TaxID=9785 RepID=UPI000C8121D9|nr:uncharacterized protein LOC111751963 isoform X2 [Loxodonta africana]